MISLTLLQKPLQSGGVADLASQVDGLELTPSCGSDREPVRPSGPPFPIRALSLACLLQLRDGGKIGEDWVAEDVKQRLVLEATKDRKVAFVESLPAPDVSDANVFVSHAWAYKFSSLAAALEHWAKKRGRNASETFVWIDLFSVNQHVSMNMTQEWWSTVFAEGIRKTGEVCWSQVILS